jgi:PAS domain S-box-containing protein
LDDESNKKESGKNSTEIESIRQRYDTLFDNTNDAILMLNIENDEILYANKKASELSGYDKEELYSKTSQDLIVPEEIEDYIKRVKKLKQGKNLPLNERTILTKNGKRIIVEVNLSSFFDPISKITLIQSIVRDISDKKVIEEKILKEREIFHNIALSAVKSNNTKEFCEEILENLLNFFDFDFGTIRILDKNSGEFNLIASINLPNNISNGFSESNFRNEEQLISRILTTKKTLLVSDFKNDSEFKKYEEMLANFGLASLAIIPILNNNSEILGLMQISSYKSNNFSDSLTEFFDSIAVMIAAALEKQFAESALKIAHDNRQEMNRIISSSPAIVFLWRNDEGWPVEYVSENITMFGYTPDDFYSGRVPFSSLIYEDDLKKVAEEVAKYADEPMRREFSQEYRIVTKSGEIHWIADYTTIRRNNKGIITHFHGIVLDITERKLIEESLKNERAALEIIANASAVSTTIPELSRTILKDLTNYLDYEIGIINLYEPKTKRLMPAGDYKAKEVLGDPLPIITIDDTRYLIAHAARTKQAIFAPDLNKYSIDEITKTTVKKLKLRSAIIWPILKANNDLLAILQLGSSKTMDIEENQKFVFDALAGALSNNFERMLVEDEKRASDERFRAFAEQNISGVFLFNMKGDIFFVNQRMSEITGYSQKEISKMKIGNFLGTIHPHLLPKGTTTLDISPIIDNNISETNEYKIRTKDGATKWVLVNLNPFKIDEEKYFAVLMIDITNEKLAEEQLKQLNTELETRVIERTAQLEILNKELEAFSYSVSHDLRTPLRSIAGFSQALSEDYTDSLDQIGQDYLMRIRNSTKRMSRLIDDMLDLSRLSRKDMTYENTNLSNLANEIMKNLAEINPERKVKIKIEKNLEINGDYLLLRQLLENLIGNSWKFTQKNSKATIEFGSKVIKNERVFFVKDNGVGFDKTYMDKLFEIFQRLHTQQEFEGTGIGLAIVKRIIDRHKGKIWAESELNKGATFFFTIPQ